MNLSCEEHYATGLAFLELGTPESAIESFQEALRASPKDTEILMALGKAYEAKKELKKAIETYSQVEEPDAGLYVTLAGLFEDTEQFERAIEYYRKCLQTTEEEGISMVYAALANCYGSLNDLPGAIQVFKDAIERFPKEEKYHFNLGMLLQAAGEISAAKESLQMALQLDPNSDVTRQALEDLKP